MMTNMDMRQNPKMQTAVKDCYDCHRMCEQTISEAMRTDWQTAQHESIMAMMDCADMSGICADMMMRGSAMTDQMVTMCAEACVRCADMCDRAGHTECAQACRQCADSCRKVAAEMAKMS
jgi:hypothetical protein